MIHPDLTGYQIVLSDIAKKNIDRLYNTISKLILKKIKHLCLNNHQKESKKSNYSKLNSYRLRVDGYRVIYTIKHEQIIVYIIDERHRRKIYNKLKRKDFKIPE